MIYIYNVISISLVAVLSKLFGKKADKILFLFSVIQMTLISGLRYETGRDFLSYKRIYEIIGYEVTIGNFLDKMYYIEPGYVLINKLCYLLNIGFVGLNLIVAFMTFYFALKAFLKLSGHMFLSIYLYISFFFFCQSMNQTRQILAISLVLYAISELIEERKKQFWIFMLIATLIHTSIVCLVPVYWLKNIKLGKRVIGLYFSVPIIIVLGYEVFLKIISMTKYATYFNSQYDVQGANSTVINLLVRLVMLLGCMLVHKKVEESKEKNTYYHMIWLCTICQVLAVYSSLWGRITTNYFIAYFILIPKVVDGIRDRKFRAVGYFACILVATLYHIVYFTYMAEPAGVVEYKSILSQI